MTTAGIDLKGISGPGLTLPSRPLEEVERGQLRPWPTVAAVKSAVYRARFAVILTVMCVSFAFIYPLAYLIRFEGSVPSEYLAIALASLPLLVVIKAAAFLGMGSHRGGWCFPTLSDMITLVEASTLAAVALTLARYVPWARYRIPISVILIDWAGTILLLGGLRGSMRLFREHYFPMLAARRFRRVLVVDDASEVGLALVRAIHSKTQPGMRVVGILAFDRSKWGRTQDGVSVVGPPEDLERHAARLRADLVLIPSPAIDAQKIRSVVANCNALKIKVQVVPGFTSLLSGDVVVQPRDVDINDLLCREPVRLDTGSVRDLLGGRVVLVTGAAGSIGSEICRQTLAFKPEILVLLDHSENGLFFVEREIRELSPGTKIIPCIASITGAERLEAIFSGYRPSVVFHAAAHKHVPMMEANPGEAVRNNVMGTQTLVDSAVRSGVEVFVMISTDKAVNPTSVMGATKRAAEMYVQSLSPTTATRLVTVRFGNVLCSNGSVVPIFKEQIRRGGPVTVTHPEMTRFFMTIPEATQLVLHAGSLGRGGEIFVLDMGRPVKVVDLARDLIRLSGMREGREIDIVFTGLRPGEKLYEELYAVGEESLPTPHPKIFRAMHRECPLNHVRARIQKLATAVNDGNEAEVIDLLKKLVPEYRRERAEAPRAEAKLNGQPKALTVAEHV